MLGIFLIISTLVILSGVAMILDDYENTKDSIRQKVNRDYNKLISLCERDQNVLSWVSNLNERFENFMSCQEYKTIKPYDKFSLKIPYKRFCVLTASIVVDKHKNLKFVVNFEPFKNDDGRTDLYLKYCIGYNDGLNEYIKKCQKIVMDKKLEDKKKSIVENIINK